MGTSKNIILCGFMGCGKTTIGKLLAKNMGRPFVDTDILIEKKYKMPTSRIFEEFGEKKFREYETEICRKLSIKKNLVIATGGGLVLNPNNTSFLKQNGIILYIHVSPKEIIARLTGDDTRPLLNCNDKETAINNLFKSRLSIYREVCDMEIDGKNSPGVLVSEIIKSTSIF